MSTRRNKTFAIIFIILFLGYYQRWLYTILYEALGGGEGGSFSSDLDPALPMIIDEIRKAEEVHHNPIDGNNNNEEDGQGEGGGGSLDERTDLLQLEREAVSAPIPPLTFLKTEKKVQDKADNLSMRIQKEIEISQGLYKRQGDCNGPKLQCGATVDCGLGCQIHWMMSCLIVAHATNRTLIPNFKKWPYQTKWTDVMRPLGAPECQVDNQTAEVRWGKPGFTLISLPDKSVRTHKSGLPVPLSIGQDLKKLPTDHYAWWIGQFAKYTMRLQSWEEELMKKFKDVLKLNLPTVGIVVRKREKYGEKKKLEVHSMDKYMSVAKRYFSKLEETYSNVTRRVFVSTDDQNVFKILRKRYPPPRWEILGFQRKTDVEDIIKDIYILSECNYVVCSFSADICRLVLELKESKELNSIYKVKSIGYKYFYATQGFHRLRFLLRY